MDKEIWKDINGYEGLYQVSNMGRVRSLVNSRGNTLSVPKILKLCTHHKGYIEARLKTQQKRKIYKVHRLVAVAFIPNPENKPQVNHINGVKADNYVENLEWVTQSENMQHAFSTGLNKKSRGERSYQSLLTNAEAENIRKEYKRYSKDFNRKALAKRYGVNVAVIKNIVNGKTYINPSDEVF